MDRPRSPCSESEPDARATAGHGGPGGASAGGTPGGVEYGAWREPLALGSGGGAGNDGHPGGHGGGAIRVTTGVLALDGGVDPGFGGCVRGPVQPPAQVVGTRVGAGIGGRWQIVAW